jgi:hypothetical protein
MLQAYRLALTFDDGTSGTVDLSELADKGAFAYWSDRAVVANVRIASSGELVWGDTVNLCPDALYLKVTEERRKMYFQPVETNWPVPEISRFLGIVIG